MHVIFRVTFILSFFSFLNPEAGAVTVEELKVAIQAANPTEAENFTVHLETKGKSRVLKVGRKMSVNPLRYIMQVQSVDLRHLEPLPVVNKIGSRVQPWVKLRTKNGRTDVQVVEQVYVDDEFNELESTEEERAVLVIPCDPYEVEKLAELLADFMEQD
ncbi:MAG: hypothetical protein AAF649_06140 [Verrucomicrobiota bacterium]